MTAVEFYDRTPLENVISSLTTVPDKIIFIGDGKVMKRFDETFQAFLDKRGLKIVVEYRSINKNDIRNIVEVLSDIIETEERCVFDLTGGEDLALFAMGMVCQKYPDKHIQLQRCNVRNGVVTDCDNDGTVIYDGTPYLSVDELIALHGGLVCTPETSGGRTYCFDLTDEFRFDISLMWNICRQDPGLWNRQLNVLKAAAEFMEGDDDPLAVKVPMFVLRGDLQFADLTCASLKELLAELGRYGLVQELVCDESMLSFFYKDDQIRQCLTKAGTILELKVLEVATRVTDKNGEPCYTDAKSGVFIDWDGKIHDTGDAAKDTENEIDVVLMKGLNPIFISCKNGHVEDDELYKLETVTDRFGGDYAKRVLIGTYLDRQATSLEYFKQRAKDMKITLIEDVHMLEDAQFDHMIKNLLST